MRYIATKSRFIFLQLLASSALASAKNYRNNAKTFKTPRRPFEKDRLVSKLQIVGKYGLRSKREAWRTQQTLAKLRKAARELLTLEVNDPRRLFEGRALMNRMFKYGLLNRDTENGLDYILGMTIQKFLERRLQTKVSRNKKPKHILSKLKLDRGMDAGSGMPRTFKLYEELEAAEHGKLKDQSVTFGLDNAGDQTFTNWNGTIVGPPNTNFDNRIYFLSIVTDDTYPSEPPKIKFNSKVNLPSVNQQNGAVQVKGWNPNSSIENCLIALKNEMIQNKKLPQPADGEMYQSQMHKNWVAITAGVRIEMRDLTAETLGEVINNPLIVAHCI